MPLGDADAGVPVPGRYEIQRGTLVGPMATMRRVCPRNPEDVVGTFGQRSTATANEILWFDTGVVETLTLKTPFGSTGGGGG